MPITEEACREALKQVVDPELFINIVDLGLIYEVNVTAVPAEGDAPAKEDIAVTMTLTSPACPSAPQLVQQSKTFLGQLEGAGNVEVKVVLSPPWSPDRMTEEARDQLGIF